MQASRTRQQSDSFISFHDASLRPGLLLGLLACWATPSSSFFAGQKHEGTTAQVKGAEHEECKAQSKLQDSSNPAMLTWKYKALIKTNHSLENWTERGGEVILLIYSLERSKNEARKKKKNQAIKHSVSISSPKGQNISTSPHKSTSSTRVG